MQATAEERRRYAALRKRHTPPVPLLTNLVLAFVVGGSICAVAQILYLRFLRQGMRPDQAGAFTAVAVVIAGSLLTGIGVYDEIVRVGGMGASLPISGFANSIVAPAMEYRREGWILGVGAKMFTVAGPVIVYGLLASVLVAAGVLGAKGTLPLPAWLRL